MCAAAAALPVLQMDKCLGKWNDCPTAAAVIAVVCNFTVIILGITCHVTLGLPYGQGTTEPFLNKTAVHKACTNSQLSLIRDCSLKESLRNSFAVLGFHEKTHYFYVREMSLIFVLV